jgi:fatty-acyl-CoA synthase
MMLVNVLHQREQPVCQGVLYPTDQPIFACLTLYRPMRELQQSRYPLLIVPQFHVMAWGLYLCLLSGSNMVLPSSNLQPEAIKILQEEK